MAERVQVPVAVASSFIRLSASHFEALFGDVAKGPTLLLPDDYTEFSLWSVTAKQDALEMNLRVAFPFSEQTQIYLASENEELPETLVLEGPNGSLVLGAGIYKLGRTLIIGPEMAEGFVRPDAVLVSCLRARDFKKFDVVNGTSPTLMWISVEDANSLEIDENSFASFAAH